ncbi:glutamate receptor ionotropic, kainate 2-like [Coccinella septempunctata]|uniref:glutamate receptor ionotropic, kainate 2-like n=1 Tax=Coccinella septempunctata TaxID=41139 RepID=UPI001D0748E9|nr:glutamate receptor ionotropic, kainate 2-like [Coccinella septempunctata]
MKIVIQNVVFWLIFACYNYLCLGEKDPVNIGVLFNEENAKEKLPVESVLHRNNIMDSRISYNHMFEVVSTDDTAEVERKVCKMMTEGIGAIFGPPSNITSAMVESVCAALEIPHIQINPNNKPFSKYTTVNFYPEPKLLSRGIGTIVRNLHFKSFVLLYENDKRLVLLQDILKLEKDEPDEMISTIKLKPLGSGPDYRTVLKEILDKREMNIILDCSLETTMQVLGQAKEIGILEKYHNFFLTSLDAHTLDFESIGGNANITTIRIINTESEEINQKVKDWELEEMQKTGQKREISPYSVTTSMALMYDAVHHFVDSVNILHVTQRINQTELSCDNQDIKWEGGYRITSYMKIRSSTSALTYPISFDENGRRTNFTIYLIQGFRENVIGYWHPGLGDKFQSNFSAKDFAAKVVQNLQAETIRVASRIGAPYLMWRKSETGEPLYGNARFEGYSMDLISEIAEYLNFKFEFYLVEDGQIGKYDETKKEWNGLIRDILDHKAELAICDLTLNHQRQKVVDFSLPFMSLGISILYKHSEVKGFNLFAFLDPFSPDVWVYMATLYLAVTIVLFFVYRLAPDEWENPHPCDENPEELENIWDIKNCLWLTLGSIMAQGCDLLPKGISSRLASSMWWFFSLIMTSSYTANLAAFLTAEKSGPTIESAKDLTDQSKIKYGCMDGGSTQSFFRESTFPLYQKMWTQMSQSQPSVFADSNTDGVKRVQNSKNSLYAFLMESTQLEYESMTKCDLKQVGQNLDSKFYAIAMPMGSSYVGLINSAVLHLSEINRLQELKKKWWEEKRNETVCGAKKEPSASLSLNSVGGIFIVLFVGVGVAHLIAIVEFLWNVRDVSVEEHISFKDALKIEIKFALSFWIKRKKTKCPTPSSSSSPSTNSRSRSRSKSHSKTRSLLRSTNSLFSMNRLNAKEST